MKNQTAFTFIEVVVAMGVVSILFGIASTDLFHIHYRTNLTNSVTTTIADIRQQQLQAMTGSTNGAGVGDNYGAYLTQHEYTLFKGTYSPTDPENRTVTLEYPIELRSISFPSSMIVFASGSGAIVDFSISQHSFGLINLVNGEQKTIDFNSSGIPVNVL